MPRTLLVPLPLRAAVIDHGRTGRYLPGRERGARFRCLLPGIASATLGRSRQNEECPMLHGIHGHQDIERVVYGRAAGPALRAEAERLGAVRVFLTTSKSVAQSALLADIILALGE